MEDKPINSDNAKTNKIIFLGGIPGVGKTSIAGSIAREFGIDIMLSGDYLREFVRPLRMDKESKELLSISVYESWKRLGEKSNDNILKGFEMQSDIICEGISALIERAAKNGENLIIESLYMNQKLIDTIKQNNVIAAYIYISDFDMHVKCLNEREFYTHFKSPGTRLSAQLDVYRVMMEHCVKLSKRNGIAVFDNMSFNDTKKDILNFIREKDADDK